MNCNVVFPIANNRMAQHIYNINYIKYRGTEFTTYTCLGQIKLSWNLLYKYKIYIYMYIIPISR